MLPSEIILNIYGLIRKWWRSHIQTDGVFASVVSRVDFPPPTGIQCNMMPIKMGEVNSIPENMRQGLDSPNVQWYFTRIDRIRSYLLFVIDMYDTYDHDMSQLNSSTGLNIYQSNLRTVTVVNNQIWHQTPWPYIEAKCWVGWHICLS
jgi:hypothetical protein